MPTTLSRTLNLATLLCCIVASCITLTAHSNPDNVVDYNDYEQALASFNQQDYPVSIIHLKNMLQQQPAHLPSRVLMAEIYLAQRHPLLAETELNYARGAGADLDRIAPLLARSYNMMRRFNDTLDITRPGRRSAREEAELAVLRGRAYIGMDKLNEARQSFDYALEKTPADISAMEGQLQVAMIRRQYSEAEQRIAALLSLDPDQASIWITNAKLHSIQGDREAALKAVTRAIALEPENEAGRLARASFYVDMGRYTEAEADVDFILENYPLEPRSKYLKAVIVGTRGDTVTSRATMQEIAQTLQALDSGVMQANPDYYFIGAVINNQLGNQDVARQYVRQYAQLVDDDLNALRLEAIIELQSGAPLAARNVLLKANKLSANNPNILALLGSAYLGLGEYQKAFRMFQRVEETAPGSTNNLANLARAQLAQDNYVSATDYLLKAEASQPDSVEVQLLLIESYQKSSKIDKAIEKSALLLKKNPDSSFFMQVYAESLGLAGRIEEAIQLFEASLAQSPSNRVTTVFLSRIDLGLGRSDAAIARLLKFRDEYGDSQPLLIEIADTYSYVNQPEEAIYWLTKALDNNGTSELALEKLVRLHDANNNREEAVSLCVNFLRRVGDSAAIHELLGSLYMKDQLHDQALKEYSQAVKYAKYPPEALVTKSAAQLSINDVSGARYSLNRSVALDADYLPPRVELARIAITLGELDKARRLIRDIKAMAPDKPTAWLLSGDLNNKLRNFTDAEAAYRSALEFGDTQPAMMGLFSVYKRSDRMAAIIPELEDWLQKYPSDIRVALALASAYQSIGDYEKAEKYYLGLIDKHPKSVVILNNAANMFADVPDYDKAYLYAGKARELAPSNATVIDTLAWVEVSRGNLDEALQLLRKAVVLDTDNPEIKYHLAVTLDKLGRRDEARDMLRESLKGPASFPDKEAANKLLAEWR